MREILFRGKRKPWDGWCEGFLVKTGDHFRISTQNDMISFGVYPETVGQYTGMTDKNGVKIFEGDILNALYSNEIGDCYSAENIVVNMEDYNLMWSIEHSNEVIVVGNIHDNPELLEVSGDG